MKRALALVLFGILVVAGATSQQHKKTDVELVGLKGKVKSCSEEEAKEVSEYN
jgi:quercetin dioxygenase-like cupin family protein